MAASGRLSREVRRSMCASIRRRQREGWFPVISEIKVRTEKEGELLRGRDPAELARDMARSPIAGLSVVTEPVHFGGHMELLRAVAAAVDLPVLHKDFVTTEAQLRESAAAGASAVLLITALLEPDPLAELIESARALGLETLVEAHDVREVQALEHLTFDLAGINNRDIRVLEVDDGDVSRTEALAAACARDRLLVSESAIGCAADVRRAGRSGADAVLVGTAALKPARPGDVLDEMTSVGWPVR